MARPVTLFTGQWADLTLEVDLPEGQPVGLRRHRAALLGRPLQRPEGPQGRQATARSGTTCSAKYGLKCWAISNHLVGQLVLDVLDARTDDWVPAEIRGNSEKKRAWADPGDEGHRPGRRRRWA